MIGYNHKTVLNGVIQICQLSEYLEMVWTSPSHVNNVFPTDFGLNSAPSLLSTSKILTTERRLQRSGRFSRTSLMTRPATRLSAFPSTSLQFLGVWYDQYVIDGWLNTLDHRVHFKAWSGAMMRVSSLICITWWIKLNTLQFATLSCPTTVIFQMVKDECKKC